MLSRSYRVFSVVAKSVCISAIAEPENVNVTNLLQTRCSARDDACASLTKDWGQIIGALEAIKCNSVHQNSLVKNEATGLLAQLNSVLPAIVSKFWRTGLK